ncbi:uncharacterized protein B0H18DRAFT_1084873 [Fomitopsis serialis]|uniref:uncharacterized protein n=1 Tax=Fomitopsis serialis TaxID=139415 RepID=UPI0020073D90|nr:uncharacterized protein B0H18DRAFT_1084873 [Neoantrodia serialis]KAH9926926.1 hypothetical protein B0H18DRAFT_1084873 [Neoantrodia serialis]
MSTHSPTRWGPVKSLLCLAPLLVGVPLLAFRVNYALPEPVVDSVNSATGLPQLSEARVLAHAKYLSEDIGFRTVGTREHAAGDAWMVQQADDIRRQCEDVVRAHPTKKLECEVWHQQGSGAHRFDMMGHRLYKTYVDLTNIVVRISDGTPEGKQHAVLVNAHVDSTLPSPGAADDALSVGIMLECMRVLVNTPDWSPSHAIIFLFNNAEESLQDASHLFSTQHAIRDSVRAAVNLEAAGTTGREMLFQATSEEMIRAYSHAPRPFGTIVASEVFSSGIILSDTDFRQFQEYMNVTGLDIAVIGNSYLYHMRKDLVENIEPGVAQHMGENVLGLLLHLSSADSPLPRLTEGFTRPHTVFYQFLGLFIIYSFRTANIVYAALFAVSVVLARAVYVDPAPALRTKSMLGEHVKSAAAVATAVVGAIVGANVVAVLMTTGLGKGLSWFSSERICVLLYAPAALSGRCLVLSRCHTLLTDVLYAGALASQLLFGRLRERTTFVSVILSQSVMACAGQLLGIGSAGVLALTASPMVVAIALNAFLTKASDDISLWSYAIAIFTPLSVGAQMFYITLDVFVPLTGRMGEEAPAEHIIASIVAGIGAYMLPLLVPFVHRFGRRTIARATILCTMATAVTIAVFSMRSPFDQMHQKRVFVIHMENITTQEQHLHIAAADSAPGFPQLAQRIAEEWSVPGAVPMLMNMDAWNNDWDVMYPVSAVLTPYKFEMPLRPEHLDVIDHGFAVSATNDTIDRAAGTRSLTLVIRHPGIIWSTIAFDAHVVKWALDDNPPDEYARHHVKEASFYGHDAWTLSMVVKIPEHDADARIPVNFVGIHEKAMWPGKVAEKAHGGRAMQLFEEFDAWLERETAGTVDALLLGCIGGITTV